MLARSHTQTVNKLASTLNMSPTSFMNKIYFFFSDSHTCRSRHSFNNTDCPSQSVLAAIPQINMEANCSIKLTCFFFPPLPCSQHATSFPSGSQPFLAPRTARRPTRSSPSATLWGSPTSRPSGSTRCPTTGTRTTSASTPTSPLSAEPSWTWCTSSSGERSLWCMTTAQVQVQSVSVFLVWRRSCPASYERAGAAQSRVGLWVVSVC